MSKRGGGLQYEKDFAPKEAVYYLETGYKYINSALRTGRLGGLDEGERETVADLDKLMTGAKGDTTVYRGDGSATIIKDVLEKQGVILPSSISRDDLVSDMNVPEGMNSWQEFLDRYVVGQTFSDKAFVSTTKNESLAHEFAFDHPYTKSKGDNSYGAVATINIKGGQKMFDASGYGGNSEKEILLPRGTSFKIKEAKFSTRISYTPSGKRRDRPYIKYKLGIE